MAVSVKLRLDNIGGIDVKADNSLEVRDVLGLFLDKTLNIESSIEDIGDLGYEGCNSEDCLSEEIVERPIESKPISYKEEEPSNSYEEERKKLVMFKCSHCSATGAFYGKISEGPTCFQCGTHKKFNKKALYKGSYECSCGNRANFLMEPDVEEVKCNKCQQMHVMSYDEDRKCYVGVPKIDFNIR